MSKKKVLVTGASGRVGQVVLARLGETYDLSALNRSPVAGIPCTQADIADLDGIIPAFEGVDAVLHLAASTMAGDWESLLATNIVGVRNVYEAARIQGVKRVVNISSGATILGYGLESPYKDLLAGEYEKLPDQWPLVNERWPIRPDSVYGASKAWGEALGRYYSDYHGLSIICVRLGAFLADDTPDNPRSVAGYTSWEDAMRMFSLCIDAPDNVRYDLFELVSDNRYRWRDNAHAKEVLGYNSTRNSDPFIRP